MLEKPKFVPMARPYASLLPDLFISIHHRRLLRASFADNTPSTPVEINLKHVYLFRLILTGVVRYRHRRAKGRRRRPTSQWYEE